MNNIFLFLLLLIGVGTKGQQWENYTCARSVYCLKADADTIWVGSEGGVAKYLSNGTRLATYTRADGLAANFINSIAVDLQGNKWFGTGAYNKLANGVSKFDGNNFTTYNTHNSGLLDSVVTVVCVAPNGDIWFSNSSRYYQFDGNNWTLYTSIDSAQVHGMTKYIDSNGNRWVGLTKFDGNTLTKYTIPYTNLGPITAYDMDSHDNIWVSATFAQPGTQGGLFKFDGTNWFSYNGGGYCMKVDKLDNVWFGSNNSITKFDGVNSTTYSYNYTDSGSISCGQITSIAFDTLNHPWIGTLDNTTSGPSSGVSKFDGTNWERINASNSSLNNNYITDIGFDKSGNTWFNTNTGDYNVAKFDGVNWLSYDLATPHIDDVAGSVTVDYSNTIWFGGTDAIYRFDGTNWNYHFITPLSPGYISIDKMVADGLGNIWCATIYGLYKFSNSNWTNYLPTKRISALVMEDNNIVWCTTNEGLYKFDNGTWSSYTTLNSGLLDSNVTAIAVDAQGNKWIGTSRGVQMFDGVNWVTYNTSNSDLPANYVNAIAVDKIGNKWIATYNNTTYKPCGVTKFDGNNWTTYNIQNSGLSDNGIYNISVDEQNNIWFGSFGGVSKLLNTDTTYSVWLQYDENICNTNNITLNPIVNNGTPPYTFTWQSNGDALSCVNCQNPTVTITQNTVITVIVTDNINHTLFDTLYAYKCINVGITNLPDNKSIILFPNPASNQLNVTGNHEPITGINIYNITGSLVSQNKQTLNNYIDISQLVDGVYIAEIKTSSTSVRRMWVKM